MPNLGIFRTRDCCFPDMFLAKLPKVTRKLGGYEEPLIWTADFTIDWHESGNDK